MSLKADDGTPLEAKEGIVIDGEGRPIASPRPTVKSFSFSLPLPAIIGAAIAIPFAVAAGLAFFSVIAVILLAFLILSWISRIFRSL